jgi:hypothetical protein
MAAQTCNPTIMRLLNEKASTKQKVFRETKKQLATLKAVIQALADDLNGAYCQVDESVEIKYHDRSAFEADISFGGDVLLFTMHSNVFTFPADHAIWKVGYIKEDKRNGYFGVINIYNFLADSFRYNRPDDVGLLLGRIFVNHEGHFFVEGKRQLGFLFNSVAHDILNEESLKKIAETAVVYGLEFDLISPTFNDVMVVSVRQLENARNELQLKTGKQMGYRVSSQLKKDEE